MEDKLIEPDDRPSSIVGVVGAALEDDCPNGGVVIGYGIDSNLNGVLDANEVNGLETICHGADGTTVNVTVSSCGNLLLEVGEECDRQYNCRSNCTIPDWMTFSMK